MSISNILPPYRTFVKYAGLIGAGLGFVAFGPIGAIIGFGIGSFVQKRGARKGPQTAGGDFTRSM